MRFHCFILIGVIFVLEIFYANGIGSEFLFGFQHDGKPVFWGADQKLPDAIEPDIRNANLTVLLAWIDAAGKMRENFLQMKERAKQCNSGMCDTGMPDVGMPGMGGMPGTGGMPGMGGGMPGMGGGIPGMGGMPDYGMDDEEMMYGDLADALPPVPDMTAKLDEALKRIAIYENRLIEELRKPEKTWNYSAESNAP